MIDRLYHFFERLAIWPVVAILVVILLISNQSFAGRREVLGEQVQVLDGRRWYTPVDVQQLFTKLGTERYFYAITEVTLDLLYPLAYGLLLAVLIVRTWSPRYEWLVLFPFLTVVADLLENFIIFYMAFTFNGSTTSVAWFAAVCTLLKSILFLTSLLILLNGGVVSLLTQPQRRY
jgi:hypothetical protein